MVELKFTKNKTYYLQNENWKLKYIEQDIEKYYIFKVVEHDDKDDDWAEYSTKDGTEILSSRKEWLDSIKDNVEVKEDGDIKVTVLIEGEQDGDTSS